MDLILLLSVAFFGVVPPVVVGWWAYRQGIEGRSEAIKLRDEAIAQVEVLKGQMVETNQHLSTQMRNLRDTLPRPPTVTDIIAALPPVKLPDQQLAALRSEIVSTINGSIGVIIREGKKGAEEAIAGAADQVIEAEAARPAGERIQNAIMGRILDLVSGGTGKRK